MYINSNNMKKLYLLPVLFLVSSICHAQNLVPNGDFEIYGAVPCGWTGSASAFSAATSGWTSPTNGTPDIHSTLISQSCSNFHPHSTYSCNNGSQVPYSGNIFSGFYTNVMGTPNREYIQAQLSSPMSPGLAYYVQFYVSLGEESAFATNNIGVWFSTAATNVPIITELGYTPQVLFTNVITDTANWVLLTDTIIPTQAYQYIIIGNFFNDSATTAVNVNPLACWARSYYYCDDVCISTNPLSCSSSIGVNENLNEKEINVFPNPFSDNLNIETNNPGLLEIIVYDITSRIIVQQQFTGSVSLNTSQFSKGIYLYEVGSKITGIKKGKVVKE